MLFIIGLGYILAVTYVFFGDIKHLYSVILTLWMYCSAIFYPLDSVPAYMQIVIANNPIYNYIACMRNCMLYQTVPSMWEWIRMIGWGVGMYFVGSIIFKKSQNKIMQYL